MLHAGPTNSIVDIDGISVGNAEDAAQMTGVTVVLPDAPVTAAVDIRGGGPGSRDVAALAPENTVDRIDALVFSGGSAFGLDAAGGAMDWLLAEGRGFPVAGARVPIVPSAVIFDLDTVAEGMAVQGWKTPPWWQLGREAAANVSRDCPLGNVGAGLGARAGSLKGGLGTASVVWRGITIAALVIANPIGSVTFPGSRHFWAWPFEMAGEFGGLGAPPPGQAFDPEFSFTRTEGESTTLAVIATDAALDRRALQRIAIMGHDGMARAIRPVHSPLDGDTVFALATGAKEIGDPVRDLASLGMLGADCISRAIARAVHAASSIGGLVAWRDL